MSDYVFPSTLTPAAEWTPVPQIEENTPAKGGAGQPDNAQAQALVNRLQYLRDVAVPEIVADAVAGMGGEGTTTPFVALEITTDPSPYNGMATMVYWDAAAAPKAKLSVLSGGGVDIDNPSNLSDGAELMLLITTDGRYIQFGPKFVWADGLAPFPPDPIWSETTENHLFRFVYSADLDMVIGQYLKYLSAP